MQQRQTALLAWKESHQTAFMRRWHDDWSFNVKDTYFAVNSVCVAF